MQKKNLVFLSFVLVLLFSGCKKSDMASSSASEQSLSPSQSSARTSTGENQYIVLCKAQGVSAALLEKLKTLGTVRQSLKAVGIVLVSSSRPSFTAETEKLTEVQRVLPDIRLHWLKSTFNEKNVKEASLAKGPSPVLENSASMHLTGLNPLLPLQWSLSSVNAKGAFKNNFKGNGARVAVLDGGFHLQHPDIKDNILDAVSFIPFEGPQMAIPQRFSHGTHVAGIIAASDNDIGTAGIAPAAKLMLVKVLTDDGWGAWSWILEGIVHAADNGADIINMSLGAAIPRNGKFVSDNGTPSDPSDDFIINEASAVQDLITAMNRVCQYARKKGALIIAAAGNNAIAVTGQGQATFYPANCVDVVAVAANSPRNWALNNMTSLYEPSSYTNYGSSLISLGGPGGDFDGSSTLATLMGITIPSWVFDMVLSPGNIGLNNAGGYFWAAGTSMACPAVAGVAALIAGKYNGNISPSQLETKLKTSAVDLGAPGKDNYFGNGQVNAGNAIKQ